MERLLSLHVIPNEACLVIDQLQNKFHYRVKRYPSPSGKMFWYGIIINDNDYDDILNLDDFIHYGKIERHNAALEVTKHSNYNRPLLYD